MSDRPLDVAIIVASTRPGRIGATWPTGSRGRAAGILDEVTDCVIDYGTGSHP